MWLNLQETADLITFTEEILHNIFNFLCSALLETGHVKVDGLFSR